MYYRLIAIRPDQDLRELEFYMRAKARRRGWRTAHLIEANYDASLNQATALIAWEPKEKEQ